ncbi:TPA: DUF5334 family protein [Pseudomonas aeruginosa]|nr:DUF5334 family protein [Pseudomonas aeruginosa]
MAWDGYDYQNSTDVEIEKGNLARRGQEIDFYDYDYDSGEYRLGDVEPMGRMWFFKKTTQPYNYLAA